MKDNFEYNNCNQLVRFFDLCIVGHLWWWLHIDYTTLAATKQSLIIIYIQSSIFIIIFIVERRPQKSIYLINFVFNSFIILVFIIIKSNKQSRALASFVHNNRNTQKRKRQWNELEKKRKKEEKNYKNKNYYWKCCEWEKEKSCKLLLACQTIAHKTKSNATKTNQTFNLWINGCECMFVH